MAKKFFTDESLSTFVDEIKMYSDLNKGIEISMADYEALGDSVLTDDKVYFIKDAETGNKTAVITLLMSDFVGRNTKTVSVNGVTSNSIVVISPEPTSIKAYSEAGCYCIAQSEDELTFSVEKTPSSNLKVNILIMN